MNQLSGWLRAVCWSEDKLCFATLCEDIVLRTVLVSISVSANNDGRSPAWDKTRDVADNDWLAEHSAIKNVSDSAIGGLPHLFEVEFLHTGLIRSDGCALDSDLVLQHSVRTIYGDLVICSVTVLDRQIVVLSLEINVREDMLKKSNKNCNALPFP
jgi:hypothetical protein